MYDSVTQYEQALEGSYNDWHPPIMARTWALLLRVWPGTAPFFLIETALWWGGLGLLAAGLARKGRSGAAAAVLGIGAFPLFLGWMTVVLKDAQMAACLTMAVALYAGWALRGLPVPRWAAAAIALLLAYATLVRGNAAFATVPLGLALIDWGSTRRWWAKAALVLAGIGAVLAVSPILNHRVMRAVPNYNERSLPLYDIVAVAHRAHLANPPGITPAMWAQAERRGCYTPFYWNPYGDPALCGAIGDALAFDAGAGRTLMRDWAGIVVAHPIAYAAHRAAHFNASLRFLVGRGEPDAIPPVDPEPNPDGLGAPSTPGGRILVMLAKATNETPLGWPVCWLVAGAGLLWALGRAASPEAKLARGLILSALVMSGSFAVASIACDLRYHLWSMIAVALALAIGWSSADRKRLKAAAAATLAIALIALVARFTMAPIVIPKAPPPITGH